MKKNHKVRQLIDYLYRRDPFSQWMSIEVLEAAMGYVRLKMRVRKEMLNGFGVCHGGITYAFADSALAFASNSYGRLSVLLKASMSYPEQVREGDVLIAETEEQSVGNRVAMYTITVWREQDQAKVGIFQGTVYRTKKIHPDNFQQT
ncbi:MAG: hotdog fold thioesterase [Calditrichaeota bacterium]|nr:MAG: hotdog fold thioesterase [Calditrichota bacterium]